jgi:hypothetical protein
METNAEKEIRLGHAHDLNVFLNNLLGSNGYVDEAVGSWHRYVDTQESLAESMKSIADSLEIISETYKIKVIK